MSESTAKIRNYCVNYQSILIYSETQELIKRTSIGKFWSVHQLPGIDHFQISAENYIYNNERTV